ncbi:MAG: hypothetical protein JWO03_2745 [Bacteroidetes bacterium]|nr:hypothetical protein [Bacteroidota bacterium]
MIRSMINYIYPVRRSILILTACICLLVQAQAQFAPVVGFPGTTAIHYDSSAFVAWATGCSLQRGYRDIAVPDSGYASVGDSSAAIGMATSNGIVSLGDGGSATLTFASPIVNGAGFDFAVFENGFNLGGAGMAFLELAFVEVSSDGVRFVRFPAVDNVQDSTQLWNGAGMDGSKLNNLAGKYVSGYGTPFDLDELRDSIGLDLNNITHVRVVDVIGTLTDRYASHDSRGGKINDPYPTNFGSSGFDLDGVGVIHQYGVNGIADTHDEFVNIFPNPASGFINVQNITDGPAELILTDVSGRAVRNISFEKALRLDISAIPAGIYTIKVTDHAHVFSKLIVKD